MSRPSADESARMLAEMERRRREVPRDFYARYKAANLFLRHGQERELRAALERCGRLPLGGRRILEVGCGDGSWWSALEAFGAERDLLCGIELDPERAAICRAAYPRADVQTGDAGELPWEDAAFDLVFQSTVFTSILDPATRRRVAAEMRRVLAPDGLLVWYDFRYDNPKNPHVRGIGAGEIRALFPDLRWRLERVTLAPPLARRLVPRWWTLAALLEATRIANTHYLGTAWVSR